MKKFLSICVFTLLTNLLTAQVFKTVNVVTAGSLTTLLTATEKTSITNLTITGNVDARDLKCMRDEITELTVLDIAGVSIKQYSGTDGTYYSQLTNYPINEMPKYSFYNSIDNITKPKLQTITLPISINSIGDFAFSFCSGLAGTLFIPNSIASIGIQAFYCCSSLTNFTVNTDNPNYLAVDGVLFNKTMTSLQLYPPGKLSNYIIPNSVTSIGKDAFNGSRLTSITLPNSVTSIGDNAFYGCQSLTGTFTIPYMTTTIGRGAFSGCKKINIINCLNPNPPLLGDFCFTNATSITDVFVPTDAAVTSYKANANWFGFFPEDIIKKNQSTEISKMKNNELRVYILNSEIIVEGISEGETVTLYTINGKQIQTVISNGEKINISVNRDAVYLVKTGKKTFKVII